MKVGRLKPFPAPDGRVGLSSCAMPFVKWGRTQENTTRKKSAFPFESRRVVRLTLTVIAKLGGLIHLVL